MAGGDRSGKRSLGRFQYPGLVKTSYDDSRIISRLRNSFIILVRCVASEGVESWGIRRDSRVLVGGVV